MLVDGEVEGPGSPSSPVLRLNGNGFADGFSNLLLGSAGAANGDERLGISEAL